MPLCLWLPGHRVVSSLPFIDHRYRVFVFPRYRAFYYYCPLSIPLCLAFFRLVALQGVSSPARVWVPLGKVAGLCPFITHAAIAALPSVGSVVVGRAYWGCRPIAPAWAGATPSVSLRAVPLPPRGRGVGCAAAIKRALPFFLGYRLEHARQSIFSKEILDLYPLSRSLRISQRKNELTDEVIHQTLFDSPTCRLEFIFYGKIDD